MLHESVVLIYIEGSEFAIIFRVVGGRSELLALVLRESVGQPG